MGRQPHGRFLSDLDTEIRAAHANRDGERLARLYERGGNEALARGDEEAGLFLLIQAYVHALEAGAPAAKRLRKMLAAHGRES